MATLQHSPHFRVFSGAGVSPSKPCSSCNVFYRQGLRPSSFAGLRAVGPVHRVGQKLQPEAQFLQQIKRWSGLVSSKGKVRRGVAVCGMNLIFVSAEVSPWSKTGGLGDVMGGLPPALAARGHRVMTISPRYDQYRDAWDTSTTVAVKVGDRTEVVRFFHVFKRGVDRVFADHPMFLAKVWGKTGSKIYGPEAGEDYEDNQLRFSMLAQAAIEAARVLHLSANEYFSGPYGENVVFVANDWHTALLPCYLRVNYKPYGQFVNAKVAFCIHNIAYQGRFAHQDFELLNLPDEFKPSFDFTDGYEKPCKGRKINWMKAAFLQSDIVLTVSPTYAQELLSGPEKGVELDDVARETGCVGIINGMDIQEWDPSADKYLPIRYNLNTVLEAKPVVKEALQAEVGLPIDPNVPLVGFIGRLEEQKGSDILAEAVKEFMKEDVQLVVLGTGKKLYEEQLKRLEIDYPNKARGVIKFNVPLAHMITAGADMMLVPSRFEPCGLIQLHAMRYGTLPGGTVDGPWKGPYTIPGSLLREPLKFNSSERAKLVPIVASTGGLVDTVTDGFTGFHIGAFNVHCEEVDPIDVINCAQTVKRAIDVYRNTTMFSSMVLACMSQDLSWKGPARRWEEVLLGLGVAGGSAGQDGDEIAPKAKYNIATP